jgi:hypothetical protein
MLTAHRLRELLSFDKKTGIFRWKSPTNTRIRVGQIAGSMQAKGSRKITIDSETYVAPWLAVLYLTGRWPASNKTFRNGVSPDTRLKKLRAA